MPRLRLLLAALCVAAMSAAPSPSARQAPAHQPGVSSVELQPLALHVRRLATALAYLGAPLADADLRAIDEAVASSNEGEAVRRIEQVLDRYVLLDVEISPESRVRVQQGQAPPRLVEGGTRVFLVKVRNLAGVTAPLRILSPNSGRVSVSSWAGHNAAEPPRTISDRDIEERWAEITIFDAPPMAKRLSGLPLEYQIVEIYSRDRGRRAAEISVDVGQGTQDIGFRNDVLIVFTAEPAQLISLRVSDERGRPAMASFLVQDRWNRVYPHPSKRLAPDFPFQSHVYRADGEFLLLPDGDYTVNVSAGPEYVEIERAVTVKDGEPSTWSFTLERWIDPASLGWYSGDHHVHAAGCSHYQDPAQGVGPPDMMRQIRGESLNVGSVLTWGPCYYHQKQFFSGREHELSTADRVMRYDLEVSGFPSSHAGHLVLLGLKEQDYPHTSRIEEWPTWGLPILRWAQAQGAVTGFAHSGWGLEVKTDRLPNDEIPGCDGIGANEFIVDVTHDAVDFISAADTPYVWELNIWYHVLNAGFRTRIAGETDFPCIYDERVGLGRTYARLDGPLTFDAWLAALRSGRSYVSDGRSHIFDFAVNGQPAGAGSGEIAVSPGERLRVTARVAARLGPVPDPSIQARRYDEKPYWDIERARIGSTNTVPVELVVNGEAVARQPIEADGTIRDVTFETTATRSSWMALRILPSAHTNPIFAIVEGKPIRASRRSAEWCLRLVDQCWTQKARAISPSEREQARAAYDKAREVYRQRIAESDAP